MSDQIRILWLIKGLGLGGAELLLARAVPHLDRRRFHYEVAFVLPHKSALVPTFEAHSVPVHLLGHEGPWGRATRVLALSRLLRDGRYDIVHVHSPVLAVAARILVRVLRRKRPRPKLVYTEHNEWARYHRLTYIANRLTFPLNDRVVTVSDAVRRSIKRLPFVPWPDAHVIYQGIDYEQVRNRNPDGAWRREFRIPREARVIVSVGNLKPHKGHDILIAAANIVLSSMPDLHFVIVGTGREENRLRSLIHRSGLETRVHLAGFREDALDIVADADIFCLASLNEGLSIALLEAMAVARPLVATAVGGVPEAVEHGIDGFVVKPNDAPAIAGEIMRLICDPDLSAQMGAAGRERAKRFDIKDAAEQREAGYAEVLAR